MEGVIKEACVETIFQCLNAQLYGANRIELCADLAADGLTPSEETIRTAMELLNIPLRVMIRPRAGDFVYQKHEVSQMKKSIDFCKSVGVEGVVFGACTSIKTLDLEVISELAEYSAPLKVTIHKAIDHCDNPIQEVRRLKKVNNIDTILTSGKSPTAMEGLECIKLLMNAAEDDMEIMACGKITKENLPGIHETLGARAYHGKRIVG